MLNNMIETTEKELMKIDTYKGYLELIKNELENLIFEFQSSDVSKEYIIKRLQSILSNDN